MNDFLQGSVYFGFFITLFAYWLGTQISKRIKITLCNPLLISIILIIAFLKLTGTGYEIFENGAKYINFFLTPVTVCLAVPLYRQIRILKANIEIILISIFSGCLSCAGFIFAMAKLFSIERGIYVSMIPKSITTAIALGMSEELGGMASVTVMAVFISGIGGAIIAAFVFKIFRIEEPMAQGLATGTASHALGTSKALELGELQAAMSSLAIAVAGMMTVIIGPIAAGFY